MKREKKAFVKELRRLVFCLIVTLLFCRGIAFCRAADEFESLSGRTEQSLAIAGFEGDLTLGILDKQVQALPSALGQVEPESIRLVPVPSFGVTAVIFVSVMVVGWLRRRTPSDSQL